MSSDDRRLEIQRYLTGELGYDAPAAGRVVLATMPLDDGRPGSHGFEAEARKIARDFAVESKGQEPWQVDRLARDTLDRLRALASEYGETYYARRYERALAGAPMEPPAEPEKPPEPEHAAVEPTAAAEATAVITAPRPAGPTGTGGAGVVLEDITKRFGDVVAVDRISLEIADGEFFSLLGPSGCGKTTSLRLVAGFERADGGRILLGDLDVTESPPHRRPVNTVFQNYALFPHLNVGDNVAFGLRFQRATKDEKRRRVGQALELVQLRGYERRKPHQLSGGQQQRVALARALILEPKVLLLDEPLGALDAKLRRELQLELKTIQREVGITFVYVTHDQEEALTMSDRLAVMQGGHIEQLGSPREVYEAPETPFVAEFLGVSNLMDARGDGTGRVRVGDVELVAGAGAVTAAGHVRLTIRPERVEVGTAGAAGSNRFDALVERLVYVGPTTQIMLTLPGGETLQALVTNTGAGVTLEQGAAVSVHLPSDALRVLAQV